MGLKLQLTQVNQLGFSIDHHSIETADTAHAFHTTRVAEHERKAHGGGREVILEHLPALVGIQPPRRVNPGLNERRPLSKPPAEFAGVVVGFRIPRFYRSSH